jgi:pimeloyl-ACP methyl ester carboxylesterase
MEDLNSNDMLCAILDDAETKYPIDRSRVYITGHSHNGFFSFEFARRHPDVIAAVATMGNPAGLVSSELTGNKVLFRSDAELEVFRQMDMPVINLSGCGEFLSLFPLRDDLDKIPHVKGNWQPSDFESKAKIWQRRLYYSNCPVKSFEEILAASDSKDKATRSLGIPNDHNQTIWKDGFEHYILDINNNAGKCHLRIVGIENIPHMPIMSMMDLAWDFLRRFARDRRTFEVVELYD